MHAAPRAFIPSHFMSIMSHPWISQVCTWRPQTQAPVLQCGRQALARDAAQLLGTTAGTDGSLIMMTSAIDGAAAGGGHTPLPPASAARRRIHEKDGQLG